MVSQNHILESSMHMTFIFVFVLYIVLVLTFFKIFIFEIFFQEFTKETFALYDSTGFELNIVINVDPNATEPLPIFVDCIES